MLHHHYKFVHLVVTLVLTLMPVVVKLGSVISDATDNFPELEIILLPVPMALL
jgi:hypothetical protein